MKYSGMPSMMWKIYEKSFGKNLQNVLGFDKHQSSKMTRNAKATYKEIIERLPRFEKGDRYLVNSLSCAQLAAFYLQIDKKPSLDKMTEYYDKSMMTNVTKFFFKLKGKKAFSKRELEGLKKTESRRDGDRNPYSWNMSMEVFEDGIGYRTEFSHCGICYLLTELGIPEIIPAMCRLDYAMAEAMGVEFKRDCTIGAGDAYCDNNYYKRNAK